MEPVRHVLPSGLEILIAPHAGAHVAAVQVYVWAGSLHEYEKERGAAHFIEHMLFKGTKKRKVGEIGALVENAGGDINAYTTFDRTVYYLTLPSAQTELGIDILADAVFSSTFDPEELEREREVILEEIRRGNDDPGSIVGKKIFSLMYPDTEVGRPIIGSVESVSGMSRDDLLGFYRRHYEPSRTSVVIAGDVDPETAIPLIAKYFGDAGPKTKHSLDVKTLPDLKQVKGGGCAVIKGDFEQTRIEIAFPGPSMTDIDGLYVDLAAYVFGGSEISRLQSRLRDRDGIVSAIGCSAYSPSFRGVVEISASVDPEQMLPVCEAIGREVALFLTSEPATSLDIDRARAAFRINRIHREETVDGVARGLGLSLMTPLKEKFESTYEGLLDRLSAEDVMSGFARWFSTDQMALVALGNKTLSLKESDLKSAFLKGWTTVQDDFARIKKVSRSQRLHREIVQVTRWNLPNGVPVIYRHLPKARMFSLIAATEGGLRCETTAEAGIFHAMAGMCGLATETRTYEEFAGRLEDIGSVVAGFSGKDSCGWEVHTINDYAEETLGMFAESLLKMTVPETQWTSQQRETLHSMKMQKDSASYRCMRRLSEMVYKEHAYSAPILGWPETIESFTAPQLERFYRNWRDEGSWVIGVAGGLPEDELKRILTAQLRDWKPHLNKKRPYTPSLKQRMVSEISSNKMDKEQAHVAIGWRGLGWSDPDRAALDVAINILGGHGGRLFVTLRDQQSLAYSVSPLASQGCDGGLVGAYLACKPDKVDQAMQGLHHELSKISSGLVDDHELERSKNHILGSHEISLQRTSSQAMTMALMELYGVGWNDFERYPDEVRKVTKEDVLRIAKRLFGQTKPCEVVVGPNAL